MANCVIVMGASGTGKSTSIKGLEPKETVVVNILGKKLPFKGSAKAYSKENKNMFQIEDYNSLNQLLSSINKNATYVKNVIIDDSIYIMRKEYFKRAKETGLTLTKAQYKLLKLLESLQRLLSYKVSSNARLEIA